MIITVDREFGSGGRELGKRLSDALEIPCYDQEIIEMIAKEHGFDEDYISRVSEKSIRAAYPMTIGRRFSCTPNPATMQITEVVAAQRKIIENFAKQGSCIIIGRCADIILKNDNPFNIFVYADKESKIKRCMERASVDEKLTAAKLEQKMTEIDKERAKHRTLYTSAKWGDKGCYHLCVNTSGAEIKKLVPGLAVYVQNWFFAGNIKLR